MDVIAIMRAHFKPKGTAPITVLQLSDVHLNSDFIESCVLELESLPSRVAIGDTPSNLEKLAYEILCRAAYIKGD